MSILDEPTNEYSMRHAANLLDNLVRANEGNISPSDMESNRLRLPTTTPRRQHSA